MFVFIFFFTLFNLFCADKHLNPCLECGPISSRQSYIQHILSKHHTKRNTCFFCDEKPQNSIKKADNYDLHGKHCEINHTEWVIGLYWYYFAEEPNHGKIKTWNPRYYEKILSGHDDLYFTEVKCLSCNQEVRTLCALYHFIVEFWDDYKICQICQKSSIPSLQKKYAEYDFLSVINHVKSCGFASLNSRFVQLFPSLQLSLNHGALTLENRLQAMTTNTSNIVNSEPIIEFLPEIYLCNVIKGASTCNAVLNKGEVPWHVAADICDKDYSTKETRVCCLCRIVFNEANYFFHLAQKHRPALYALTWKIEVSDFENALRNDN